MFVYLKMRQMDKFIVCAGFVMKSVFMMLFLLFSEISFADDGGVLNLREWTYGNIYVKEPNDKIALKKELMEVDKDSLRATFIFENTTDEDVVVDCAFPIVVETKGLFRGENDTVSFYDMFYRAYKDSAQFENLSPLGILTLVSGRVLESEERNHNHRGYYCSFSIKYPELKKVVDCVLKKWSFEEYSKYVSDLNLSEESVPAFMFDGCDIVQDGKKVRIENVGMETRLKKAYGDDEFDLIVSLHFHHKLTFPKGKSSKVVITHGIESLNSGGPSSACGINYDFSYNISTGGTWKGEIDTFVVMTPFYMESSCSKFSVFSASNNIYYKNGYKPQKDEVLKFKLEEFDEFFLHENVCALFPAKKEAGFPVSGLNSSDGVKNVSALFDGDIYTYVSVKDWKEAWVDFTLDGYVVGPLIVNGQCANIKNEAFYSLCSFDGYMRPDNYEFQDSVWNNANRVKTVALIRKKTEDEYLFSLEDEYSALASGEGWVSSNCVKRVQVLSPGTYRMKVREIFSGDKGHETGLSEMFFVPIDSALVNMFAGDRRSYSPIFQSALEKYLSYEAFRANWFGDYSYRKLPKQGKTEDHLLDSLYNERYLYGNSNGESDKEISVYTDSYVKPDNKASETSGHGKAPSLGTRSEVSAKSNFSPRVVLVAGVATLILLAAGFAVLHERSKEKGERRKA